MTIEISKLEDALNQLRGRMGGLNFVVKMQIKKLGSDEAYLRDAIKTVADVRTRLLNDTTDALVAGHAVNEPVELI